MILLKTTNRIFLRIRSLDSLARLLFHALSSRSFRKGYEGNSENTVTPMINKLSGFCVETLGFVLNKWTDYQALLHIIKDCNIGCQSQMPDTPSSRHFLSIYSRVPTWTVIG